MLDSRNRFLHYFLPRRLSLIQKLTILTGTVVILFMSLFAWININNLQQLLVRNTIRDLDSLASSIIQATRHQMLLDNRELVYQMLNDVAHRPAIDRIRMINAAGVIVYSTASDEIGKLWGQMTVQKPLEHTPHEHPRFFTLPDGRQVLGLAKMVDNGPGCSTNSCHAHRNTQKVLGAVDIVTSLQALTSDLTTYRNRIILLTVLLIILLGASLTFFTLHLVNRPVNELLRHTGRLAQGLFDGELSAAPNDELGDLMRAFQAMTVSLRDARSELEVWGRTLEEKVRERSEQLHRVQMQLVHTEKLASLGELVAGIAHEINNPLSGILIFSSLVAKDKRLDPALCKDLETISSEAQRCAGIVKGLLEFARDYQPQKTSSDVNKILRDSLKLVECQSVFQNVTILRQFDNNLPLIMADQNQLKQVFINIFINAGQAMQHLKRGELQITTRSLGEPSTGVFIQIKDSGYGVPEEQLGKLFDPFFTTKGAGGTGLGLSVSYGIIQAHGGTITVQSRVGTGTTFSIQLPVIVEAAPD